MPVNSARELKQHLFEAYGSFADKRYRNVDHDLPFIVDDRTPADFDARGQLFLWFCQMFATVQDQDRILLFLRGGMPRSDDVLAWFGAHGARQEAGGFEVEIRPDTVADLENLARRFESILKKRYDTKAYKYVVPRTAASLRRLRTVLEAAWG